MRGLMAAVCAVFLVVGLPAQAACQLGKVAALKIIADGNRFFVPGNINDREILFMVDSGAERTVVLHSAAKSLGLNLTLLAGEARGVTGTALSRWRAQLDSLSFGSWSARNLPIEVTGEVNNFGNPRAIALLGQDFLRNFDVEFDIKNGLINLFTPQGCDGANLAYWSDSYNVVDMVSPPFGSHHVLLRPKVNDIEVTALLDSGAWFSTLTQAAAGKVGVHPDAAGVVSVAEMHGISGAPTETWMASFASFALDEEVIKPAKLRFFKIAKSGTAVGSRIETPLLNLEMILGADFIRAHRVLISQSQRKVYFTYAGGPAFQSVGPRMASGGS
jgi:predicted aspartyl protease